MPDERAATCRLCAAGSFQEREGVTSCDACTPGYFCVEGAATPVPCPAGTSSNMTGSPSSQLCVPVPQGFWAPLGSALPEPCPLSGFFCPGAAADTLYGGSKPIVQSVGGSTEEVEEVVLRKEMSLDVSIYEYNETAVALALSDLYGVPVEYLLLTASSGSLQIAITFLTTNPSNASSALDVDVNTLRTRVSAVDDLSLGASVGAALGNVTLRVTSTPVQQATVLRTVEFRCPRGMWW